LNVFEAVQGAALMLKDNGIENPVWEAGLLMGFVLKKDISYIYTHHDHPLSPGDYEKYMDLARTRANGMPYQYITQNQEFMSLDFFVTSGCLVPRPETETLVDAALSRIIEKAGSEIRVLDIGTGSGAIAVSIAYYASVTVVDAIDVSHKAIEAAKHNAKTHAVNNRVHFLQKDFFSWVPDSPYDIVLSNPPYIPSSEISSLPAGIIEYEPVAALDGGPDGLMFYREIAAKIEKLLKPGGSVFVETGAGQAGFVSDIFENHGLYTSVYRDLAGTERVVRGDRK
jgi:release factor glutamine methyltransferase